MICVPLDRAQDHYTKSAKSIKLSFVMDRSELLGQVINSVAGHRMTATAQKVILMLLMLLVLLMMTMKMLLMLMTR